MSYRLQLSDEAIEQLERIAAWWDVHRPASPNLFLNEFARSSALLQVVPLAGVRVVMRPRIVRRLWMKRSGYHIYYTVDERKGIVGIRAIWHAKRGAGPKL